MRGVRAISGRFRGFVYCAFGIFANGSGPNLVFGTKPRFINTKSMQLGRSVHFGAMARLECYNGLTSNGQPRLSIGAGTSFGDYCHIGAFNCVSIGRNVLGASNILIIDHNHGNPKADLAAKEMTSPKARALNSKGPIVIGDNVWIGEGAIILAGARIGDGCIIAARAIVRGDVPECSIYFGE